MLIIAHRANLEGPNPKEENSPSYIAKALREGFNVEIDLWYKDNGFFLGHDKQTYPIEEFFLEDNRLWCHAKNVITLERLLENEKIHCLFHSTDEVTLTSRKIVWTYPGGKLIRDSICVLPELGCNDFGVCLGVCTDYGRKYRKMSESA